MLNQIVEKLSINWKSFGHLVYFLGDLLFQQIKILSFGGSGGREVGWSGSEGDGE